MASKYVVLFEPDKDFKLQEGEKEIEKAIAVLLPSKIKTDPQAVRKFKKMLAGLKGRAKYSDYPELKDFHPFIKLCKILR